MYGLVLLYLAGGYVDRSYSDFYRIYEALHVYEHYISKSLIFGGGLGKVFIDPFGDALLGEVHLGIFTILLKLGLVGLITIVILIQR